MVAYSTEFNYSTTDDGDYKKDIMNKKVNFKEWLINQVRNNITVLVSKPATRQKFRIKFEFPSIKNDVFEVYYISPYLVCVTCVLVMTRDPLQENIYRIEKESHQLQANNWLYIATIHKSVLNRWNDGMITFEFKYQILPKSIKIEYSYTPKVQLADDFENLLNNGTFSDVTMKSIEGTEFKVHKNILAARSVVLKANFEHNTTECQTNIIESPLEADVLREVVMFIYSDKAPRVDEMPEKLLAAADYYQLEGLKILCEEPLLKKLTIENAIETLELADLHSADTFKQKILKFIKNSPMSKITKTEGWSNIKSVELVKHICEYVTADDVLK